MLRYLGVIACLLLALAYAAAVRADLNAEERALFTRYDQVVVHVRFEDPILGRRLAASEHPMRVDYDNGEVTLVLDEQALERLYELEQENAFTVVVDADETERLGAVAEDALTEFEPISTSTIPEFPCYRTVEETLEAARRLEREYPDLARVVDTGDSHDKSEGRGGYDMLVLVLTNRNTSGDKPKTFITSAIHAREFTTAELTTRFAEHLAQRYGEDPDITWILDHQEVHLMLQSNPDARKIAERQILWRKNNNAEHCPAEPPNTVQGVDLNRNFDFRWNCCGGSSANPCNQTFHGPGGGSEAEIRAIQSYARALFADRRGPTDGEPAPADTMGLYLDIHSSGELILWPWGHSTAAPPNGEALQRLGRKLAFFNDYFPTQTSTGLYATDGDSMGEMYGNLGVAALTYELGTEFFEACDTFESRVLERNISSLTMALRVTRAPYLLPAGPEALDVTLEQTQVEQGTPVPLLATFDDGRFSTNNGRESAQPVAEAAYYVDTPPWQSGAQSLEMQAEDGRFDEVRETARATVDTSSLALGRHTIYAQARDQAGNLGPLAASFLQVTRPSTPSCDSGSTVEGRLDASGDYYQWLPDERVFFSDSGSLTGCLSGPDSTNFDLRLYAWIAVEGRWVVAAESATEGSNEIINHDGGAGYYIWLAYTRRGSGAFEFSYASP